jgi:hypothetical protein
VCCCRLININKASHTLNCFGCKKRQVGDQGRRCGWRCCCCCCGGGGGGGGGGCGGGSGGSQRNVRGGTMGVGASLGKALGTARDGRGKIIPGGATLDQPELVGAADSHKYEYQAFEVSTPAGVFKSRRLGNT